MTLSVISSFVKTSNSVQCVQHIETVIVFCRRKHEFVTVHYYGRNIVLYSCIKATNNILTDLIEDVKQEKVKPTHDEQNYGKNFHDGKT